MFSVWKNWNEAVRFAAEANSVICMRLALLAGGGARSREEAVRMVAEKLVAFTDAEVAAFTAMMQGQSLDVAAVRAYGPLRRAVHANNRRLRHGPPESY